MKVRELIYIGVIVLLIGSLFVNNFELKAKPIDNIAIDSTLVAKKTQAISGVQKTEQPQPIVVVVPSQNTSTNDAYLSSLTSELKNIKDANKQRDKLLKELALRVYEKTYGDSLVTIKVRDSVNGHLQSQLVSWEVKPQEVKFYEKKVTEKVTPKFSILAGAGLNASKDFQNSSFNLNLGYQSKKGDIFSVGYNTQNQWFVGYQKSILRKY